MTPDLTALDAALAAACDGLLSQRTGPHWQSELSPSALSTATAVFALTRHDRERHADMIHAGLSWLTAHANDDGGFGDTPVSRSNLSTTLLAWSAFAPAEPFRDDVRSAAEKAQGWIAREAGGLDAATLARAVEARYGRDRTFAVPILTMCALAGRLGDGRDAWRHVRALPFELAALPRGWFRRLGLPVVSYALPALISIGQARHAARPPFCPVTRLARALTRKRTLRILREVQPPSGGYLEAAPLTGFVAMSLVAADHADSDTVADAVAFLTRTARPDGSWPIDTNLATWATTLSVNALAAAGELGERLGPDERRATIDWLLEQQHTRRHPYTGAEPGGWAWTDLPGGVPDADDTAGAMLALHHLGADVLADEAALAGADWLADLQNRDGGVPTFCRGWGSLPFDRSAADLTAHALSAWTAWAGRAPEPHRSRLRAAAARAVGFLLAAQRADGSWRPLWFGNEAADKEANPTYGTARVVSALAGLGADDFAAVEGLKCTGVAWLLAAQQDDGGWGGDPGVPPSIEETAQAVEALARAAGPNATPEHRDAVARGAAWLVEHTEGGRSFPAAPIGLYFAKLWYFERLYPVVFTVAALGRARGFLHGNRSKQG